MAEQMEQINVEEIMQDIRTQIAERGYTKNELKFCRCGSKRREKYQLRSMTISSWIIRIDG